MARLLLAALVFLAPFVPHIAYAADRSTATMHGSAIQIAQTTGASLGTGGAGSGGGTLGGNPGIGSGRTGGGTSGGGATGGGTTGGGTPGGNSTGGTTGGGDITGGGDSTGGQGGGFGRTEGNGDGGSTVKSPDGSPQAIAEACSGNMGERNAAGWKQCLEQVQKAKCATYDDRVANSGNFNVGKGIDEVNGQLLDGFRPLKTYGYIFALTIFAGLFIYYFVAELIRILPTAQHPFELIRAIGQGPVMHGVIMLMMINFAAGEGMFSSTQTAGETIFNDVAAILRSIGSHYGQNSTGTATSTDLISVTDGLKATPGSVVNAGICRAQHNGQLIDAAVAYNTAIALLANDDQHGGSAPWDKTANFMGAITTKLTLMGQGGLMNFYVGLLNVIQIVEYVYCAAELGIAKLTAIFVCTLGIFVLGLSGHKAFAGKAEPYWGVVWGAALLGGFAMFCVTILNALNNKGFKDLVQIDSSGQIHYSAQGIFPALGFTILAFGIVILVMIAARSLANGAMSFSAKSIAQGVVNVAAAGLKAAKELNERKNLANEAKRLEESDKRSNANNKNNTGQGDSSKKLSADNSTGGERKASDRLSKASEPPGKEHGSTPTPQENLQPKQTSESQTPNAQSPHEKSPNETPVSEKESAPQQSENEQSKERDNEHSDAGSREEQRVPELVGVGAELAAETLAANTVTAETTKLPQPSNSATSPIENASGGERHGANGGTTGTPEATGTAETPATTRSSSTAPTLSAMPSAPALTDSANEVAAQANTLAQAEGADELALASEAAALEVSATNLSNEFDSASKSLLSQAERENAKPIGSRDTAKVSALRNGAAVMAAHSAGYAELARAAVPVGTSTQRSALSAGHTLANGVEASLAPNAGSNSQGMQLTGAAVAQLGNASRAASAPPRSPGSGAQLRSTLQAGSASAAALDSQRTPLPADRASAITPPITGSPLASPIESATAQEAFSNENTVPQLGPTENGMPGGFPESDVPEHQPFIMEDGTTIYYPPDMVDTDPRPPSPPQSELNETMREVLATLKAGNDMSSQTLAHQSQQMDRMAAAEERSVMMQQQDRRMRAQSIRDRLRSLDKANTGDGFLEVARLGTAAMPDMHLRAPSVRL